MSMSKEQYPIDDDDQEEEIITTRRRRKKKPKMKKRTKFTIIAVFNIVWYTIAVLILSFFNKMIPSELTVGWYSAWTVELALLFGIKVKETGGPSIPHSSNRRPPMGGDQGVG